MSLLHQIRRLLKEPPPEFVFEFSEAGIAWARHARKSTRSGFVELEPGVLSISPVRDNVLIPEKLEDAIAKLAPPVPGSKRRRPAAMILPDFCCRVAVLDFDSFPSEPQEQASLVRFRVKKSVPFDLDAASVSFHVQPHPGGGKRKDVVVAVVSQEILARYEAPLRVSGLQPGLVTISALSTLNLLDSQTLDVTAKLSGRVLSIAVTEGELLRMYRCVELAHVNGEEVSSVLFPTFAYIEDELKKRPERTLLCGFGHLSEEIAQHLAEEMNVRVEPLRSPYGMPGTNNAGLLGYLHQTGMERGDGRLMKIQINLSNEPFRRDRPWVVATTAFSIILLATLGYLTYAAVMGRDEALEARQEVEKARKQLTLLTAEQQKLNNALQRPENTEVIELSVFLNQLLLRKGISWTRIFSDLEKVLPYNVRLIQVRPQITPSNDVYLEMVVGAQSTEPVVEMLMKLEASPEFGATHWANWLPPSQTEPLNRYRISVNYSQKL